MLEVFFVLIFIALFFFWQKQVFMGFFFSLAAFSYLLLSLTKKAYDFAKKGASKSASVAKKELQEVAKAQTSYPEEAVSEMVKEVGRKAGEQVFNEDGRWSIGESSKEIKAKLGKTAKNLSSKFSAIFK
ncbi:MAG: hypothetical protein N3F05_04505 [Candidatus Diapherotrites archaeon]|nr:hypothetical protein [Candidatus Diapherotrites archaeon]